MADERAGAAAVEQEGGVLELVQHEALPGASFHLVSAQIAWATGAGSEGWGRDADLHVAHQKAAAEAVERHAHATLPGNAVYAPANALARCMHPDTLVRYDDEQRNAAAFSFATFSPGEERWWLPALGVHGVPDSHVLADFACSPRAFAPAYRKRLLTHASSSGCASGGNIDEAIARATLELVERDAFMRHWFAQSPGRALRGASLPARCRARLRALRRAGCRAGVQCLTRGVHPVLLAWAQHEGRHFTCVGCAAGFDAEAALESALNEMETHALARLAGVPPETLTPEQVRSPADHAALYATRQFHGRADALLAARGEAVGFAGVASACRIEASTLYARLLAQGHALRWADLSLPAAANFLAGAPLYTVRAFGEGLVPIAFGLQQQPFGMATVAPGGRFPHPFN